MMGNVIRGVSTGRDTAKTERVDDTLKGSEDNEMLVVLQDYPSRDVSDVIFSMGEKLKVISQEAYWWKVRSVQTGTESYIPGTHVAKVYHGWLFEGVVRQKAEELLSLPGNRIGSFMVRENTKERGLYSLSVRHRAIKHYRILRLDNRWYYISPRLTFQCLEDMVNHYSDSADGLCCVLTSPCLSSAPTPEILQQPPPVVMRHNFDWNKVDGKDLISAGGPSSPDNRDNMVSYGVRNSLAAYLSLAGSQDPPQKKNNRTKKSKSVCVTPDGNLFNLDYEDGF